jgi:hypothetical protein
MTETVRARAGRRLREEAKRALVRVLGRRVRCAECGRHLCRLIPIVWRGELRLIGAAGHNVRVTFKDKESLEFRHLELDRCPTPDRPWVR